MDFKLAPETTRQEIEAECRQFISFCHEINPDLEHPALDANQPFVLYVVETLDELHSFFTAKTWPTHASVIFGQLVFINQEVGKDKWWTFKNYDGEWFPCDIFPMRKIASTDIFLFKVMIGRLETASLSDLTDLYRIDPPPREVGISFLLIEAKVFETAGIHNAAEENPALRQFIVQSLTRFMKRDWGDVDEGDRASNDAQGDYHLASYNFPDGVKVPGQHRIWIIFNGTTTTILFPNEY